MMSAQKALEAGFRIPKLIVENASIMVRPQGAQRSAQKAQGGCRKHLTTLALEA
ncbi:hypothetical protein A0J61_02492, partial [Choanephora cucurbitarum]